MKFLVSFSLLLFILAACNKPNTALQQSIRNADSVAVNFFKGDGTMDTVIAVKIISDRQTINKLAILIAANNFNGNANCGYDGSLHFFKMDKVVQDIDFRMSENDCMVFSFIQFGNRETTSLSAEAKELITSFRKK